MNVTIHPSPIGGSVTPPPSKSHVHRLLIASALCNEQTTAIYCPGENADIGATIRCLKAMYVQIWPESCGNWIMIEGPLKPLGVTQMDCGESGSTLRFMLPLCGLHRPELPVVLSGSGRLPQRPNGPLLDAMAKNGARICLHPEAEKRKEQLPIIVSGGMQPGDYTLPGHISSQYFTGLLFALPLLSGDSTLRYTTPLESMPYVDLTLSVLRQFGIRIEAMEMGWRIPGNQRYCSPGQATAEGDWSAAAFWETANYLGNAVTTLGMNAASAQGDKAIGQLLQKIGGEINVTDTPDLMPILSIAAAATPGKTVITGAARLRIKESDRLAAMAKVIRQLGGHAEEMPDGLIIHGGKLKGGIVNGMNDHRVVMSAAIAATVCEKPVTILGAEAASKSYPAFFEDYKKLGGMLDER